MLWKKNLKKIKQMSKQQKKTNFSYVSVSAMSSFNLI